MDAFERFIELFFDGKTLTKTQIENCQKDPLIQFAFFQFLEEINVQFYYGIWKIAHETRPAGTKDLKDAVDQHMSKYRNQLLENTKSFLRDMFKDTDITDRTTVKTTNSGPSEKGDSLLDSTFIARAESKGIMPHFAYEILRILKG